MQRCSCKVPPPTRSSRRTQKHIARTAKRAKVRRDVYPNIMNQMRADPAGSCHRGHYEDTTLKTLRFSLITCNMYTISGATTSVVRIGSRKPSLQPCRFHAKLRSKNACKLVRRNHYYPTLLHRDRRPQVQKLGHCRDSRLHKIADASTVSDCLHSTIQDALS